LFRKKGKLPSDLLEETYQTEYGDAVIEVQADSLCEGDSILLVDDLIATGGTLLAAVNLVKRMGASVYETAAIVDLPELGGSHRLQDIGIPTFTLTAFSLDDRSLPFRCRRSVGIDGPAPPKVGGNSSLLVPIMTLPGSAFAPDVKSNSGPFRDIAARGS